MSNVEREGVYFKRFKQEVYFINHNHIEGIYVKFVKPQSSQFSNITTEGF